MEELNTENKIIDAAVSLFNTKGFAGTSVREIAKRADVNVALISYYFKGKQGLLEHLMSSFFDGYIQKLEGAYRLSESKIVKHCLQKAVLDLLAYQQENNELARFVHRETTIDSTLIREIMTLYLRKEKFYWRKLFEKGFGSGEFKKQAVDMTVIQLKGMLMMPYIHPQYLQEIFQVSPTEDYFTEQYGSSLLEWIDERICYNEKDEHQQIAKVIRFTAIP